MLERLPELSQATIDAFGARNVKTEKVYEEFVRDYDARLFRENPRVWAVLRQFASRSDEPELVLGAGFALYALLEAQVQANQLGEVLKIPYTGEVLSK